MPPSAPQPVVADLYPLEEFYERRQEAAQIVQIHSNKLSFETSIQLWRQTRPDRTGRNTLFWTPIDGTEMPEPYRSLLVHTSDMTSTLENFHKDKLHVELLGCHSRGQEYYREVVLRLDQSNRRVEFGAIKIMLDLFPADARQEILRERQPLGRILTESGVEFSSQPRGYLRVAPDDFISRALNLDGAPCLYGRRNTLVDSWEQPLAEILEILPPA